MRASTTAVAGATDEQLNELARGGDGEAFSELYRRHRRAARSTARWMMRSRHDVDDVVSDAFTSVLSAWQGGAGPQENFRAYLLACVRNRCRLRGMPTVSTSQEQFDASPLVLEDPERYDESNTIANAFSTMPTRWQRVLWMSEVEQRPPKEIAEALGIRTNALSTLTYRARQAFATAYLAQHVAAGPRDGCPVDAQRLSAYVRDSLADTDRTVLEHHLLDCDRCRQAVADLSDMNASLRSLAAPAAAGAAWTGLSVAEATVAIIGSAGGGLAAAAAGAGAVKLIAATMLTISAVAVGATVVGHDAPRDRFDPPPATVAVDGHGVGSAMTTVAAVEAPRVVADRPSTTSAPAATSTVAASVPTSAFAEPIDTTSVPDGEVTVTLPSIPAAPAVPPVVVSLPPVQVPLLPVPPIHVPVVSLPPIDLAQVTLPPEIRLPLPALPEISVVVPPVSLPGIAVQLPPITVPPLLIGLIGGP